MISVICSAHIFSPSYFRDPRVRPCFPITHFGLVSYTNNNNLNYNNHNFCSTFYNTPGQKFSFGFSAGKLNNVDGRRKMTSAVAAAGPMFLPDSPLVGDIFAMFFSGCFALSILRGYEETAKRGIFNQKLNRKLVHTTIGLAFMLCWPLFSSGRQGAVMAALIPAINIVKVLLIGLGIWKDEAAVKSMSRDGDYRELVKGPLYYASTIALSSLIYWRTSPIAIAAICNLCAGDGMADIIGRRFGTRKIPYNKDKSFAGSIAMAAAGFIVSLGYMHYFSMFGYLEESWQMIFGFLIISIASALVESHPISTTFDDNLMVPLTSLVVGTLVF